MYSGKSYSIPCGQNGLHTDDSQDKIEPFSLIEAKNVQMLYGITEKERGSKRWNPGFPFASGVISIMDWWPDEITQRMIAVCRDGKVYKQTDGYSAPTEITASGTAPVALQPKPQTHVLACGVESALAARKLFIFSGNDPVQVISGDGATRANISLGALDWSGTNQPSFGIIHRGKVFAMGNLNQPHFVYASSGLNHEDFQGVASLSFNVFPGEGERLLTAWVYKGRLFVAKYPRGIYYLNDQDSNSGNWYFQKLNNNFGVASPHSAVEAHDDMLVANVTGSITSLAAAFQLGEVKAGDLLNNLRNEQYMRQNTSQILSLDRWGLYYEDKKQVYFTYKSPTSLRNDRMLIIDVNQKAARVTWSYKDQPNCLALRKDNQFIQRPVYGADDGHVYLMDQEDREAPVQAPPAPITSLVAASGLLSAGDYYHKVSFVDAQGGETLASSASNVTQVTTPGASGKIQVYVPVDPDNRIVSRKVYRTAANGTVFGLITTISDNTTTIYLDNIADASIGAAPVGITTISVPVNMVFQTPQIDLGDTTEKNFDFLEISYEPTGNWSTTAKIYIDGKYSETVVFSLFHGNPLGVFRLDNDVLSGRLPRSIRKPIKGKGRTISVELSQNGYRQNIRIQGLTLYFRGAGQAQKGTTQ